MAGWACNGEACWSCVKGRRAEVLVPSSVLPASWPVWSVRLTRCAAQWVEGWVQRGGDRERYRNRTECGPWPVGAGWAAATAAAPGSAGVGGPPAAAAENSSYSWAVTYNRYIARTPATPLGEGNNRHGHTGAPPESGIRNHSSGQMAGRRSRSGPPHRPIQRWWRWGAGKADGTPVWHHRSGGH